MAIFHFNADQTNLSETQFMKGVPVSVHELQPRSNTKVYPNPASDFITIEDDGMEQLRIFNSSGLLMMEASLLNTDQYVLSVRNWPAGIYYYNLQAKEGVSSGKVVVGL
jgi:hypothetical protein